MTPHCGLAKEDCVSNQTLKDESCLVPCSGLYADIADDSRYQQSQQDMLKGISLGLAMYSSTELRFGNTCVKDEMKNLYEDMLMFINSSLDCNSH